MHTRSISGCIVMSSSNKCYIDWFKLAERLKDTETTLCKLSEILGRKTIIKNLYQRYPEHPSFTRLKYNLILLEDIINNITIGISYTGRIDLRKHSYYRTKYPKDLPRLVRRKWLLTYGSLKPFNTGKLTSMQRKYIENYFYSKTILHRFPIYKEYSNNLILSNRILSFIKDPENPELDISLGLVTGRITIHKCFGNVKETHFMGLYPACSGVLEVYYVKRRGDSLTRLIDIRRGSIEINCLTDDLVDNGVYLLANVYDGVKTRNVIIDRLNLSDDTFKLFLAGNLLLLSYYILYINKKTCGGIFVNLNDLVSMCSIIFMKVFNSFSLKELIEEKDARDIVLETINRLMGSIFMEHRRGNTIKIGLVPPKPLLKYGKSHIWPSRGKWSPLQGVKMKNLNKLSTGIIGWGEYYFIDLLRKGCSIVV